MIYAASHQSSLSGNTDRDLAAMNVVHTAESDEVIVLNPRQNLALQPAPSDDSDSSNESPSSYPRRPRTRGKARAKKERKVQIQNRSIAQPSHPSLRPAKDILSRIRHDPSLNQEDFIVGYSDRHADVKELPVTLWKGDVTEDEFIPQHRILYFRRVEDGVKVWDRAERLDLLFGSGKGGASEVKDVNKAEENSVMEGQATD